MRVYMNTWAWVSWLVAILVVTTRTRNPLYLLMIILVEYILATQLSRMRDRKVSPFFLRVSIFFIITSAVFNAFFAHYGQTVLFTVPSVIPIIGGPVTLEAIIYGSINGLVLATMFGAFTVISLALSTRSMIRLTPRAYYPAAVVISIALTFLPNTLKQFEQIREAQTVRGHRMRGIHDWLPLVMPLLIGGLERAFKLSESMTARGFASQPASPSMPGQRLLALFGILAILVGWMLRLGNDFSTIGILLILLGTGLITAVIWSAGRRTRLTAYRQESWRWVDSLTLAGAVICLAAVLIPLPFIDQDSLVYNPYPMVNLPAFDPVIGISLLGLLLPLVGLRTDTTGIQNNYHVRASPNPESPIPEEYI